MSSSLTAAAKTITHVFKSNVLSSVQLTHTKETQVFDTFAKFARLKLECQDKPSVPEITKYTKQY